MHPTCSAPALAPSRLDLPPELVAWPEESARRAERRRLGLPTILVLDAAHDPPADWDDLEDWVRLPIDPDELAARVERVRLAHQVASAPVTSSTPVRRALRLAACQRPSEVVGAGR